MEDAKGIIAGLGRVSIFGFNIALEDTSWTAQIDTTPVDGVPVVPPGESDALVMSLAQRVRRRAGHEPGAHHPRVPDQPRLGSGLFGPGYRGELHRRG